MNADVAYVLETLASGIPSTLAAVGGGIALTIVLSLAAGVGMLSRHRLVRFVARAYVEGFRGTSEVVQLFWFYFVLPILVGIDLLSLEAGILVLGLNHGAYGAEIVRGALQSVPSAQVEGAVALNFTWAQRLWRVILPQAVVEMLPPFNNLFIQLLKASSLLSFIELNEVTFRVHELAEDPTLGVGTPTIFGAALGVYLVLALVITAVMRVLEHLAAVRVGRQIPKRDKALARVSDNVLG